MKLRRLPLSKILIPTIAIVGVGLVLLIGTAIGLAKNPESGASFIVKWVPLATKPATDRITHILESIASIPEKMGE